MTAFELPPIAIITGPNGGGKTTLGQTRFDTTDVPFMDVSDLLRIEATSRGLDPTDRSELRKISAEWGRELNSPAVMAMKAFQYFGEGTPFSAVSIRRPAEAQFLKDLGGAVVWVDAPVEIRWQNANARARDEGDIKTLDEFIRIENEEMHSANPEDPYLINMVGVRDMADFTYLNEAIDLETARRNMAETFGFPTETL